MHAQGLSSVTQKKGGKKSRSNSGKFYIYNLTWKELKKPPSLHTQKNKSQQSHTRTNSISRCCPVGKAEEREDRLTDTTEGQRELIQAQKRRTEASTLETAVSDEKGSQCLITGIATGLATELKWGGDVKRKGLR